jgi:hypothetical protein
MTVTVANTANTNTWFYLINRTNELADAMTNKAVTVNSNTAVGNAGINGYLFVTNLQANTVRGGNSSITTVLTLASNVNIATGNTLTVGNSSVNVAVTSTNVVVGATVLSSTTVHVGNSSVNAAIIAGDVRVNGVSIIPAVVYSINVQTSGTSAQLVDSFESTVYRGGDYTITIKNNSANAHQLNKLLVIHNTGDAYITDYGVLASNTQLGTYTANANSTHCRIYITPTVSNTQIKGLRTIVVV